jgi:hypothetical protein
MKVSKEDEDLMEWERPLAEGRRSGSEVVEFLREKGARLGEGKGRDHWAAHSGDEARTDDERWFRVLAGALSAMDIRVALVTFHGFDVSVYSRVYAGVDGIARWGNVANRGSDCELRL